ncbi:molybdopterin cofactor-binding domain-containing protein [Novosphingobium resinovorum]
MGQGVTTLIPQIVAHELGADWRQVAAEPAPVSALYANLALAAKWAPLWMPLLPSLADEPDDLLTRRWAESHVFDVTADGTEIAAYEAGARAAAASARAMLAQAAAARWSVAWEECEVANGFVTHENKKLPFGPLASEAARFSPPSTPPLRPEAMAERPGEFPPGARLSYPRLDLPSKVDGSWTFAGDVRLPDMVFAAIRHGPIGRKIFLSDLDESAAKDMLGFLRTVRSPEGDAAWVAAVATDGWAAEQALTRMEPGFRVAAGAESDAVDTAMDEALHNADAHRIYSAGDMALVKDRLPIQLGYEVSPAIHVTIETAAATAWLHDGKLELWVGTQAPQATREAVAAALGMAVRDVVLYPVAIGGSFDRRLEFGHAVEAALIAREVGKPVQLTWSRREEFRAGLPRAPVSAVMAARPDTDGQIAAGARASPYPRPRASSAAACWAARRLTKPSKQSRSMPIRWRSKARCRLTPFPTSRSTMSPCASACPLPGCAAMPTAGPPSSTRASSTNLPTRRGASPCPTAWRCWATTRASPPASSASRRWRNGAAARMPAGRGLPAT